MRGKKDVNKLVTVVANISLLIGIAHAQGKSAQFSLLFFILIASISIYTIAFCASDNSSADYKLALTLGILFLRASDHILLCKHQSELRQIGQKTPPSELSFKDRLKWAGKLVGTQRGIGWAHEPVSHIPPRPSNTTTRGQFLLSQIAWILFYFVLFDVVRTLIRSSPPCLDNIPRNAFVLQTSEWLWRPSSWLYILSSYSSLSLYYSVCSIVSVALKVTEPREWPHLFGSPWDAYTVRRCWGRVWHQLLRRPLTAHADFIAKQLHLPKRSTFTNHFKLLISFFISGLLYHFAECMHYQPEKWTSIGAENQAMRFFLLQVAAITFEDVVFGLGSTLLGFGKGKPNAIFRALGFIWVFGWFAFSFPTNWTCGGLRGVLDEKITFSLVSGLTSGEWRLTT